ncbi:hypothetical protein PL10110_330067 [Planktothrix agardhii]|nr:hypothetical protein PL10110_330067 [Planktothrix agardhii]
MRATSLLNFRDFNRFKYKKDREIVSRFFYIALRITVRTLLFY